MIPEKEAYINKTKEEFKKIITSNQAIIDLIKWETTGVTSVVEYWINIVKDKINENPEHKQYWLHKNGTLIEVDEGLHDIVVEKVFLSSVEDFEKEWVRITDAGNYLGGLRVETCQKYLTTSQKKVLKTMPWVSCRYDLED